MEEFNNDSGHFSDLSLPHGQQETSDEHMSSQLAIVENNPVQDLREMLGNHSDIELPERMPFYLCQREPNDVSFYNDHDLEHGNIDVNDLPNPGDLDFHNNPHVHLEFDLDQLNDFQIEDNSEYGECDRASIDEIPSQPSEISSNLLSSTEESDQEEWSLSTEGSPQENSLSSEGVPEENGLSSEGTKYEYRQDASAGHNISDQQNSHIPSVVEEYDQQDDQAPTVDRDSGFLTRSSTHKDDEQRTTPKNTSPSSSIVPFENVTDLSNEDFPVEHDPTPDPFNAEIITAKIHGIDQQNALMYKFKSGTKCNKVYGNLFSQELVPLQRGVYLIFRDAKTGQEWQLQDTLKEDVIVECKCAL